MNQTLQYILLIIIVLLNADKELIKYVRQDNKFKKIMKEVIIL